jgi:hypothetical protein
LRSPSEAARTALAALGQQRSTKSALFGDGAAGDQEEMIANMRPLLPTGGSKKAGR